MGPLLPLLPLLSLPPLPPPHPPPPPHHHQSLFGLRSTIYGSAHSASRTTISGDEVAGFRMWRCRANECALSANHPDAGGTSLRASCCLCVFVCYFDDVSSLLFIPMLCSSIHFAILI